MDRRSHTIDHAFLVAILAVFACGSLLVAVFGARQYQRTVSSMDRNHEERTCSSYIREKVRQTANSSDIEVIAVDNASVLVLSQELNNSIYCTYIYAKDGRLCEVLLPAESTFSTNMGEEILDVEDINFKLDSNHLLNVWIRLPDGNTQTAYISCENNF